MTENENFCLNMSVYVYDFTVSKKKPIFSRFLYILTENMTFYCWSCLHRRSYYQNLLPKLLHVLAWKVKYKARTYCFQIKGQWQGIWGKSYHYQSYLYYTFLHHKPFLLKII